MSQQASGDEPAGNFASAGGFSAGADSAEKHSVGRNSAVMAAGTLVSRVLGLVRTSLTGAAIGLGVVGDAFNGANQLPNYIYLLLSGGLLEPVIVPQIAKAARRADSKKYVNQLITVALLLLFGVTVIATLATPWLFGLLRLVPEAQQLGTVFAFICLPQIFFYGLYTVLQQVLNARGSYAAPMWSPALNNVVMIIGLAAFIAVFGTGQEDPGAWGAIMIWLFAGASTLGIVTQGVVLIPPLIKDGFRYRPSWGFPVNEFKSLSRYTFWTFLALLLSTIGGLVILSITSQMPTIAAERGIDGFTSGNNVMNYAFMIFMLPQSIIAVSVITALFPPMTRAWQNRNLEAMQSLVKQGLDLPAVFLIPATFAMIALSGSLVHVIFPGNSSAELNALGPVLAAMCIGMVPMAIQTLQQKYCFASEQGKLNLVFQVIITGIQMLIAWLALQFGDPRHGVFTVALGQSVAYLVVAVVFIAHTRRQLGGLRLSGTLSLFLRLALASLVGGFAAWGAEHAILTIGLSWIWQLVAFSFGFLAFVALFSVIAKMLKIREYFDLVDAVLGRFRVAKN